MSQKTLQSPAPGGGGKPSFWQNFNAREFFQKYTMIIALVVVTAAFGFMSDWKILSSRNLANLVGENAYVFVLATGMLLCILTGGNIDLSVGSVVCFTGAVGCIMLSGGVNMWLVVLTMLAIGLCIGVFQGFWIAKVRVPAFIATLAGMYAFRGIASTILNGQRGNADFPAFLQFFGTTKSSYVPDVVKGWLPDLEKVFTNQDGLWVRLLPGTNISAVKTFNLTCMCIGLIAALVFVIFKVRKILVQKKMGISQSIPGQVASTVIISLLILWICFILSYNTDRGFPMVLIRVGLVLGIYAYITNKTAIGRHLYAVGGNEKAAALSGIKTRNVYWFAYANIGLLAGLAGILTAGYNKGIDPANSGDGYEMDAIAACFIGGASAYGGTGKVSGMIVGATLMGIINKGMNLTNVEPNYQKVVKGLVLLLAVLFDVMSKRQKR